MEPESNKISVFTYKCIGSTKYKAVNIFEETSRNRIKMVRKFQGKTIQNIRKFQEKALSFFQPKILRKKNRVKRGTHRF